MKEQGLISSTITLTITSFFTRTLGMISVVFLSHLLDTDGMGLYHLTMSVYMIAVVLASAGISMSVSKLIAEELGQKHFSNVPKVMRVAFTFTGILSSSVTLLLYYFAPLLAKYFVQNPATTLCLRILGLSIPFMACASCFKGYFYATKKAVYPASSEILEQIIKVTLMILLVKWFKPSDLIHTYATIALGLTIGEMSSWSYLLSLYIISRRKEVAPATLLSPASSSKSLFFKLLTIALPVACISYLACLFVSAENYLIPVSLQKFGASTETSMSLYGMLKGMVMPILFFPSAFLTAFSTTLVPEIAKANVLHHKKRVTYTTNRVVQLTFILSVLVVSIFINYSDELGMIIYNQEQVGPMLRTLSLIVPFMYVEVVTDGILKGLGKQVSCLKYSMFDSVFRISMIYLLLPLKGISAFIGIMIVSNILTSSLNFNKLLSVTGIKVQFTNWIFKPMLAATAGGTFSRLFLSIFLRPYFTLTTKVIIGIALTCFIYIALLFIIESLSEEDMLWLKEHLFFFKTSRSQTI